MSCAEDNCILFQNTAPLFEYMNLQKSRYMGLQIGDDPTPVCMLFFCCFLLYRMIISCWNWSLVLTVQDLSWGLPLLVWPDYSCRLWVAKFDVWGSKRRSFRFQMEALVGNGQIKHKVAFGQKSCLEVLLSLAEHRAVESLRHWMWWKEIHG